MPHCRSLLSRAFPLLLIMLATTTRSLVTTAFGLSRRPLQHVRKMRLGSAFTTTPQQQSDKDDCRRRLFPEDLNIIYDSKCNVCQLEIEFLRKRDLRLRQKGQARLKFTDLEGRSTGGGGGDDSDDSGDYDPDLPANAGIDYATGMTSMHGVTADGKVLKGVPVFRKAYEAVDLGWLFAITTWPGVSWVAGRLYDVFAKYRTRLTRGTSVERLVEAYGAKKALAAAKQRNSTVCKKDACKKDA
jgi:predicted DCC family thiol-disulfide oxidoreductase YuxK